MVLHIHVVRMSFLKKKDWINFVPMWMLIWYKQIGLQQLSLKMTEVMWILN